MNLANTSSLCGGATITPSQDFFTADGGLVILNSNIVLPHSTHSAATVISDRFFTCNGLSVTATTDLASCADDVTNGVSFIEISD